MRLDRILAAPKGRIDESDLADVVRGPELDFLKVVLDMLERGAAGLKPVWLRVLGITEGQATDDAPLAWQPILVLIDQGHEAPPDLTPSRTQEQVLDPVTPPTSSATQPDAIYPPIREFLVSTAPVGSTPAAQPSAAVGSTPAAPTPLRGASNLSMASQPPDPERMLPSLQSPEPGRSESIPGVWKLIGSFFALVAVLGWLRG